MYAELKSEIDKIFQIESESNSVSEDFLFENGIDPNSLIGDAEIQLAKDALEEEEDLKKMINVSIISAINKEFEIHKKLHDEILEHFDRTEQYVLAQDYLFLLEKYTNKD
jgi:hypothetical protein